jgi:hypothetical protein
VTENDNTNIEQNPKLWNPNAAACWSIIFTPIFGAWVHARNWKTLKKTQEEKWSMMFVYGLICLNTFIVVYTLFISEPKTGSGSLSIGLLLTWYFSLGKQQVNYLKDNISNYEKKSWLKPLLLGVSGYIISFIVVIILSFFAPWTEEDIKETATPLVTQILQDNLGQNKNCESISIENKLPNGDYEAIATLDDGSEINITIQEKGQMIYVSIP